MRSLSLVQIAFLPALSCLALADVSISGLDDIRIDSWAGTSGDLRGVDSYCALSYTQRCSGPWWNRSCTRTAQDYDVAAYADGASDSAGMFFLRHSSSSAVLPITLEWSNAVNGTFVMTDYLVTGATVPSNSPFAPGATQCSEPGAQNTLSITVREGDLGSVPAGRYSETFRIDMCRLNGGGSNTGDCAYPVSFEVELPDLAQITRLDDVAFGGWSGSGDLERIENFCVFRNGSGGFSLLVTGGNDGASMFHLQNGTELLPYQMDVSDGDDWISLGPNTPLSSGDSGFVGSPTRDCGGQDSHSLRVSISEADLLNVAPGAYADTVTVLVAPE